MAGSKGVPFKYRLSIMFFLIVLLISMFLGMFQYAQMNRILSENHEDDRKTLRSNVIAAVSYADKFYNVVEKKLEPEAKKILEAVRQQYAKTREDGFDLRPFVESKSGFDLSVINQNNRIVNTTQKAQLGLNYNSFKKYVEFFNQVRVAGVFFSDRFGIAVNTSDIKQAYYLPSADGSQIFCIEVPLKTLVDQLNGYGFDNFEAGIGSKTVFVDSVMLYDSDGNSYKYSNLEIPSHVNFAYKSRMDEAIRTNKPVMFTGLFDGNEVTYEYIPYKIINATGINRENVIELVYNDAAMHKHLRDNLNIIFAAVGVGAVLSLLLGLMFASSLAKPITKLSEAAKRVAKGDYNISIESYGSDEIGVLCRNFERMTMEISALMEIRKQKEVDLQKKSKEIQLQNDEINALYEETAAMNEELSAMNEELADRNEQAASMNEELAEKNVELESLLDMNKQRYLETVRALASAIEAKDFYTGNHSEAVRKYSMAIAQQLELGEEQLKELEVGSMLHDIGKIGIPEDVLNKQARFTDEEYTVMKRHPSIGYDILKNVHMNASSRSIIYEHHERFDGSGYPRGLKGEEIGQLARIVCVADAYHAMTSSRSYRKIPLDCEVAIAELEKNKGTQFDPVYVDALIHWLREHSEEINPEQEYNDSEG